MAEIDENGQYELTTYESGDGARVGKHKVTVEARTLRESGKTSAVADDEYVPIGPATRATVVWLAPEKYASVRTTPLSVVVKDTDNNIDLTLSSKR